MARHTYTGRLTNAQRTRLAESRLAELVIVPEQSAYAETGLMVDMRIPVTVDPDTGDFSVRLEASDSMRPRTGYKFRVEYFDADTLRSSDWVRFWAAPGGGDIFDVVNLPPNPGTWSYGWGPPSSEVSGLYFDLESGAWWCDERVV